MAWSLPRCGDDAHTLKQFLSTFDQIQQAKAVERTQVSRRYRVRVSKGVLDGWGLPVPPTHIVVCLWEGRYMVPLSIDEGRTTIMIGICMGDYYVGHSLRTYSSTAKLRDQSRRRRVIRWSVWRTRRCETLIVIWIDHYRCT